MIKEIYKITNIINNKIYIGQSVNAKVRFSAHKSNARTKKSKSAIDLAIEKYGVENFKLEIIETTENFNERERYWINYYNCLVPNGYNIQKGGENYEGGSNSPNSIVSFEKLNIIIEQLKFSKKKITEIAKENEISSKVVSAINRGTAYKDNNLIYPLRSRDNDLLTEEQIKKIKSLLLNSNYSLREISRRLKLNTSIIQDINKGKKFFDSKMNYPLRETKKMPEYVNNILYLLKESCFTFKQIAEKNGVSYSTVQGINSGKYYHNSSLIYPIRVK